MDLDIIECTALQVTPDKFCAYGLAGQTTCPGDSGGGFVVVVNSIPTLIGVTSTSARNQTAGSAPPPACESQAASYNHFKSHLNLFDDAKNFLNVSRFFVVGLVDLKHDL